MKDIFQLSDRQYNILKWTCLIFLPAFSTAYAALSYTWGLPFGHKIPATVAIAETFLGALLGVSTAQYNKRNPDGAEGGDNDG